MKKVVKFLLAIILLIPFCVDAKEVTYNGKIYGAGEWDQFVSIVESENSYFAAATIYGGVIDGVVSYGHNDIRIFKYSKNSLEVESQIIYGGSGDDSVSDMVISNSKEFILAGNSNSKDIDGLSNNGSSDALLVKLNNLGEVIWQKNWGGNDLDWFDRVSVANDGYIAVGSVGSTDIDGIDVGGWYDAVIVKFDKMGNLIWQKDYGDSNFDRFFDVVTVSDGYVVVGDGDSKSVILKYDFDGNIVWEKSYEDSILYSVVALSDGSIIAVGKLANDAVIVKLDEDGNLIWQKSYGGSNWEGFYRIRKTSLNELLLVGSSVSDDIIGIQNYAPSVNEDDYVTEDAILAKYDIDGNLLEHYIYGGNGSDTFYDVISTSTGYLFVGDSNSTNLENIPFDGGYTSALILDMKINYNLQKETEEVKNGTYELKQVGQRAEISINPDNGYELDKIIVKDALGNEVSYYEENGKYYVNLINDIVVDVKYKQKSILNPNTGCLFMILEIIVLFIIFSYSFVRFKKKKNAM